MRRIVCALVLVAIALPAAAHTNSGRYSSVNQPIVIDLGEGSGGGE